MIQKYASNNIYYPQTTEEKKKQLHTNYAAIKKYNNASVSLP